MGHRIITAALCNRTSHVDGHLRIFLFQHIGFIQVFINLKKTVMPHHIIFLTACPEEETRGIHGIIIKERILLLDGTLDRCIKCRVGILCHREQDMILRASGFAVLFLHMITTRNQGKLHVIENIHKLICRQPVFRIFRVVVVTVQRNHRRRNKIGDVTVTVLILGEYLVMDHRLCQFFPVRDFYFVRIQAVRRFASAVRSI